MIKIVILIIGFYLLREAGNRIKEFLANTLGFEALVEEFRSKIQATRCPDQLRIIYQDLLDLHNNGTEFDFQKRTVKEMIEKLDTRIMIFSS